MVDTEYTPRPGERVVPITLVARELRTGQEIRVWQDELQRMPKAPYGCGADTLVVSYSAPAEMGVHVALGWPMPRYLLDLFAEFRVLRNGYVGQRFRLLDALHYFGLPTIAEKEEMRALAIRGGPYTDEDRLALMDYCAADAEALEQLLLKMAPSIDWPRAILRGRYGKAVACIEDAGIPIDVDTYKQLVEHFEEIRRALIRDLDQYELFDEDGHFKLERFERWLIAQDIPWPRLPTGALAMGHDIFSDMAKAYPRVGPIKTLRNTLAELGRRSLPVGPDGCVRCSVLPFAARSGRNIPKGREFIFSSSTWWRSLIRPEPGMGIAYLDWSQQEYAIAGYLSQDANMIASYESGDPYIKFAVLAGAAPSGATKKTHGEIRENYKACALATLYGQQEKGLAVRIQRPIETARDLLRRHKSVYQRFWAWADATATFAALRGQISTVFGFVRHADPADPRGFNDRSFRNHPVQGGGGEMLRIAACLATERGVRVIALIHDAMLIEAPIAQLEADVARAQQAMSDASAAVLGGPRIRTEVTVVRHPDRYISDKPGAEDMWKTVMGILAKAAGGCNG